MKTKFIILFLLVSATFVEAQSFIDSTKTWTVRQRSFDGSSYTSKKINYYFGYDTLVNGISYTQMMFSDNSENSILHSLWREDNDGKVYFVRGSDEEQCVYDFQLQEGDTFNLMANEIIVDSVLQKNFGNTVRKFLYAHYSEIPDHIIVWVEGVGSLYAPFISDGCLLVGGDYLLICYHQNEELLYLNPSFSDCNDLIGTAIKDVTYHKDLISLFPSNNLLLQINTRKSGNINFYTQEGKHVLTRNIPNNTTNIQFPERGIYIYCFTSKTGKKQSGKISIY